MATQQIRSHLPGVYYRKPAPDQPAFKNDGDRVVVGDVVGLIEVMKTFHELKSNVTGTIVRFLVEDEDAVMAGQPVADVAD